MTEQVQKVEQAQSLPASADPMTLMASAIANGNSIEVLERLMALQERWQAQKAKEAFFNTLTEFQRIVPAIKKTKSALFDGKEQYKYADLADIINSIKQPACDSGIAYQWKIEDLEGEKIRVTCFITAHGHTEATSMVSPPDPSGKKNAIQAKGSAIEYMKRYTLAGALGLSISEDNDGGRLEEWSLEDLEVKITSFAYIRDMIDFHKTLPSKWKNSNEVKKMMKDHETFLKNAAKKGGKDGAQG